MGINEIAQRLNARPQTVSMWKFRGLLPNPKWTVSGQPAWEWKEVEKWARTTKRFK